MITEQDHWRWKRALAWASMAMAVIVASALLNGCTSAQSTILQHDTAVFHTSKNSDLAMRWQKHCNEQAIGWLQSELDNYQRELVRQNAESNGDPQDIAKNYIAYYDAVNQSRANTEANLETSANLVMEQLKNGEGFLLLADMAKEQSRIASETAQAAVSEAMKTGQALYSKYQETHPVPLPDPTPAPTPVVEVTP